MTASSTTNATASPAPRKPELRHEFVALMFAVAVAEIGVQLASIVRDGRFWDFLPAYAHLTLALILIAASWVGWSKTRAPGGVADVEAVLSLRFLVLLLDVLIV